MEPGHKDLDHQGREDAGPVAEAAAPAKVADTTTLLGISRAIHGTGTDGLLPPGPALQSAKKGMNLASKRDLPGAGDDSEPQNGAADANGAADTAATNGDAHSIASGPADVPPGLGLSKAEYLAKQDAVFQQLCGYSSPRDAADHMEERDANDQQLADMMRTYMTSLDEQAYGQVELQQRLLQTADTAATKELSKVLELGDDVERYGYLTKVISDLQDQASFLQYTANNMVYQRNAVEGQRTAIKARYASELAKRVRLDHMVRVMSKKLVDVTAKLETAEEGREAAERAQRQAEARVEALEAEVSAAGGADDDETAQEMLKETTDLPSLDAKLRLLYREVLRLQKSDSAKEIPATAEKILARIMVYIDNARGRKNQHIKDLLKAFLDQYEARDKQLQDALARAQTEQQIYLARCDRLEKKNTQQAAEIKELVDRSVDLVLTDKQLRQQLASIKEVLKHYHNVVLKTSKGADKLGADSQVANEVNEALLRATTLLSEHQDD